jgi:hypothetical protein
MLENNMQEKGKWNKFISNCKKMRLSINSSKFVLSCASVFGFANHALKIRFFSENGYGAIQAVTNQVVHF